MELVLIIIPLIACALFWAAADRKIIYTINAAGAGLLLLDALFVLTGVYRNGSASVEMFNRLIYIDSFSGLVLLVTTLVGFLASLYSISYIDREYRKNLITFRKLKIYFCLFHAFLLTMVLTTIVQNMGVMWIAVEATTLASAFLVGFHSNRKSIEAAWKYIIICSVGIAFALLGIIMLYYSSQETLGESVFGLNWQYLHDNAFRLQGSVLKIAFIFILVGFGTKVGLAPMHTWLPDAHSQAPSPVSALLSGVLLNTAMYGIIRVMIVVNRNAGSSLFTGRLLMILGILSIGTAAVFIIVQKDFKRILAYSSIEHMGILAFGFGMLTPLSIFGSLCHILNHAFTKSLLFMASGNVYLKYGTRQVGKIRGIMKAMLITGAAFLLAIFAITGMPPFSIFSSELNILTASFNGSHYIAAVLVLLFLTLIFAGFMNQMVRMFYGNPPDEIEGKGEPDMISSAVMLTLLTIITVTGIFLPEPLEALIGNAATIISGGVNQ